MQRFFSTRHLSRRELLQTASCGFGYLALASLCSETSAAESSNPLAPKPPHFTPHAKRVIFLFMQGAPSHVDTFDYKPQLAKDDGKAAPGKGNRKLLKSPFTFKQHGKSGLWLPEIFPELAKHADDLCLLNSLQTDLPNHPQASVQMHTGNFQQTRPSMGAWTLYGLGTENQELPGFITINPPGGAGGAANYGSAFLPAAFQGTKIGAGGKRGADQVANLENSRLNPALQRKQLDLLQDLNKERLAKDEVNNELEGVIESYELAFRMEGAVPQVMDYSNESQSTLSAYGVGEKGTDGFAKQCLLARRFVEAGVRFVEISLGNWDQHKNLKGQLTNNARAIDKPIAALMSDLKQRGLFKDTLLVWGGEFGRTPSAQTADGRDHNAKGFSMWMAGGGAKGGIRYGATDEYGTEAVKDPMHIHDMHATLLYLLGLDHERLTYRYSGRDFKLTDTAGKVHKGVVA